MNNVASMIDHTILKADTTKEMVEKVCQEAREYGFASVCVNTYYAKMVTELLAGTDVKTCCVVGFPLGAMMTSAKAYETQMAVEAGAKEIDMVINVGALKDGDYEIVKEDIKAVVEAAKDKAIVKVIIETCLLTDDEKIKACELSVEAGAHFVKTSTGFSTGGATKEDIELMRKVVGPNIGVKASGGIRTLENLLTMKEAGASRVGASSSVAIVNDSQEGLKADY